MLCLFMYMAYLRVMNICLRASTCVSTHLHASACICMCLHVSACARLRLSGSACVFYVRGGCVSQTDMR